MEGNSALFQAERQNDQIDRDPGFLEEKNELITHEFTMHNSVNPVRVKTCAVIKDNIYN